MNDDPPVYRTEIRFNAIYVIESIPDGEPKTGQDLFDEVIYPGSYQLEGLIAEHRTVRTAPELFRKLDEIRDAAGRGVRPFIHFETHGFDTGLALADGSLIEWRELTPALTRINQGSEMSLVVLAMMCEGWNLMYALRPTDRSPINMLIAPAGDISHAAIFDGTRRFYRAMFEKHDINAALEAMNDNAAFAEWPIHPGTAEILFCRVFRMYLESLTVEQLGERERDIVARLVKARNLTVAESLVLREVVRRDLRDYPGEYERLRKEFLMLDLFPQNSWRFGLTYEKCLGGRNLNPPA